MILTALYEYYQRKPDLPRDGLEWKEIPFLITLRPDGTFLHIEDTREGEGRHKRGKRYLVPQAIKKSVNIAANLLWGNIEYVLGLPDAKKLDERRQQDKEAEYRKRLMDMHAAFRAAIEALPKPTAINPSIVAVKAFLAADQLDAVQASPLWPEVATSGANVSFKVAGEELPACSIPAVIATVADSRAGPEKPTQVCLITGAADVVERTHPAIKGVRGAQTSGANVVSFNHSAFTSYGKEQGANAPVGKRAAFAYTTALNHLLTSPQRVQVGDASTVFWAEAENPMESLLAQLFDEPPKDDPDRGAQAVRALFEAPRTGAGAIYESKTRFYVLGLAPNAARIAVRFWHVATVGELAHHIRQHFEDIRIVHRPREPDFLSLFRLLVSTAVLNKADNIPPNLGGELMRAIITGTRYPEVLLQAAVRRSRAERDVGYPRASLIKACLNRKARVTGDPYQQEIGMQLDDNPNVGYRLGRLFAVLEKIQEEASGNINATIRDRYYGSASSTPATAFPTLMRLKNHHLAKIDSRGRVVNLERLIGGILGGVDHFPAHLSLSDQGRFAIGYYHQRQDLFTRHSISEDKDS